MSLHVTADFRGRLAQLKRERCMATCFASFARHNPSMRLSGLVPNAATPHNHSMKKNKTIDISVNSEYIADQSRPGDKHFVFAYTVTVRNHGDTPAQLVSRHWVITDSNGRTEEVRGEGVVGEQPWVQPGDGFQYSSGAVLETAVGTMHGSYQMQTPTGDSFEADIPQFVLSIPRTLH